jgi:23S rRNA (cytosine1962-C5)-methyltransferase
LGFSVTTATNLSVRTTLRLKPKRHYPFLARHPWVHAHALADEGLSLNVGDVVELVDHDGNFIARGLVNPTGKLRVRLYAFDAATEIDDELFRSRIDEAIARRRMTGPMVADGGERLVFSESDLLSGLIVDRYSDALSVQFTSAALMRYQESILDHLQSATQASGVMVRVDDKTAKFEGMSPVAKWHRGIERAVVEYQENGLKLSADLGGGQKTGGYLDQRFNHAAAAAYMKGRRVLDVCCYHGGFGLVAKAAGAQSVMSIDSSMPALEVADQTAKANGIEGIDFVQGDCFDVLDGMSESGETFDAIILDPPRFAGARHQVDAALRAYHRLNLAALKLLPPGGVLVTCSCSGRVTSEDFLQTLADVGRSSGRDLVIVENRGAAPDHPVAVSCPESRYLKCVIAVVS